MSVEWYRHMRPDRTLLIEPPHNLPIHREWFPDATVCQLSKTREVLDEKLVREWLDGLDVVYVGETFYDWRICDWARDANARTVCHVMPEYWLHGLHDLPSPDVWWTPTRWRLGSLPAETRVVPVPIATERWPEPAGFSVDRPPRWLHVAGARAAADRNGTRIVLRALRHLVREHDVRIRSQDEYLPSPTVPRKVHLEVLTTPTVDYWQLYDGADLLVLPRRYAGLSLPALEAMGAGLGLVMSATEPQLSEWPIIGLDTIEKGILRSSCGPIPLADVTPTALAARMDWLADHPDEILGAQKRARVFAESQSWAVLEPTIRGELERAAS
jgi:hypothetical protein